MADNSSNKLARSAERMQASTARAEESADRRTELAGDRTVLAAERTYAAWVRTGFVALASGVGAEKVLGGLIPHWLVTANATVLILFSAFCFMAAVWRQLNPFPPPPKPDMPRIPPVVLLGVNGFLALVSLACLGAILFETAP